MSERTFSIPSTISPEAQKLLKYLQRAPRKMAPHAFDQEGWSQWNQDLEASFLPLSQKIVDESQTKVETKRLGGIPLLELTPPNWRDNGQVLIYLHGGAFTSFSARTQLPSCIPLAVESRLKVMSIDYSLAPKANWRIIQQETLIVFQELLEAGYNAKDIGICGDSAGGNLALSLCVTVRDTLRLLPAAIVLWSPWADLRNEGDSSLTLKDFDPILHYENHLASAAEAYAQGQDLEHPSLSPLYSDFKRGMPPTLIQESTRTIFLSTSVRLYRALDAAGVNVSLDMYEGMPHGFHFMGLPESKLAIKKSAQFFLKALS
jgi:acetyl esterase/lipase